MQMGPFVLPSSRARCRLLPMELTLLHQLVTTINNRLLLGRGSLHGPRDYLAAAWRQSCTYVAQAMATLEAPPLIRSCLLFNVVFHRLMIGFFSRTGDPSDHTGTGTAGSDMVATPDRAIPDGTLTGLVGHLAASRTGVTSPVVTDDQTVPEPSGASSSLTDPVAEPRDDEIAESEPPAKRHRGG